jgi:integrator complex subunit 5
MSYLARKQGTNQHILCRALLESILRWKEPEDAALSKCKTAQGRNSVLIKLKEENVRYGTGTGFKFRKIPLNALRGGHSGQKGNQALDSRLTLQLLLDGVRSCVVDTPAFALLLVECVTPDVMFNDLPWPDEDFLKVTIERDLHISRMFESYPILWDFCTLIGNAGCLHYCEVLIRALMAVQLTQWASATASKEKLGATQKLVSLIAKGGLIPESPFKYLPEVVPELDPWEIFCVLNDLWRFIRDNSSSTPIASRPLTTPLRRYLERLRIIMAHNFPGPLYVSIFKGLV